MLAGYRTLVFDCDGVILNSNRVKTDAFFQAALPYGVKAAEALVAHHVTNGGISRYAKFKYFLDEIVPTGSAGPDLEALLATFAAVVRTGLMECAVAEGLQDLRDTYPDQRWLIVSGGDQVELRDIFAARGLDVLFDGGIFGSPDTKDSILEREIESGKIRPQALFLGDSIYDHQVASATGLDFLFISAWSEVVNWQEYVQTRRLSTVGTLADLVSDHMVSSDREQKNELS